MLSCSVIAATIVVLGSSPADACSCIADVVSPVWPHEGASDVPLDAPLVIAAFDLNRVGKALVAEDGTTIELAERNRLETGEFACAKSHFVFLAPVVPLKANTRYVFTAWFEGGEVPSAERITSFETGTRLQSAGVPDVKLHAFGSGVGAGRLLDVYIETTAVEPLFAVAQGETALVAHDLDPLFQPEGPFFVPFGVVDCGGLTIVDVAGRQVTSQELCQPSKCADVDVLAVDSCGGETRSPMSWADWQQLPDGCEPSDVETNDEATNMPPDGVGMTSGNAVGAFAPVVDRAPAMSAEPTAANEVGELKGCGFARSRSYDTWICGVLCVLAARRRQKLAQRAV